MLIDKAIFKTNGTALFITDKNYIAVHIIDIALKGILSSICCTIITM